MRGVPRALLRWRGPLQQLVPPAGLLGAAAARGLTPAGNPEPRRLALGAVRQAIGMGMHTLQQAVAGQQAARAAAWPYGASAARDLLRLARGGGAAPPLVAVPLVLRRRLHVAAFSLVAEEGAAAAVVMQPVAAAAAAAGSAAAAAAESQTWEAGSSGSGTTAEPSGRSHTSQQQQQQQQQQARASTNGNGGSSSSSSSGTALGAEASSASSAGAGAARTSGGSGGGPSAPPSAPPVRMVSGASMLPHPDKAHRGGEDAFFIADPPMAVGVADGVGGWAEIGVDAGAYARLLMDNAREEAEALLSGANGATPSGSTSTSTSSGNNGGGGTGGAPGPVSPQDVLERAYYRTNVQGSSTVCILSLHGSTLRASNLGDSGFVLVRGGRPAFQSPQQQHNFNFPYQIGSADGGASDAPQSAMRFELQVQPGDIIITGTDGLWDNVFAEEAAAIVARCRAQGDGPEAAASVLCRYARMRALDPKYHSPFSYAAIQAGYSYIGGKLDDITVLVSYITAGSKL